MCTHLREMPSTSIAVYSSANEACERLEWHRLVIGYSVGWPQPFYMPSIEDIRVCCCPTNRLQDFSLYLIPAHEKRMMTLTNYYTSITPISISSQGTNCMARAA